MQDVLVYEIFPRAIALNGLPFASVAMRVCKASYKAAKTQLSFWLPWLQSNADHFISERVAQYGVRGSVKDLLKRTYTLVPRLMLEEAGVISVVRSKKMWTSTKMRNNNNGNKAAGGTFTTPMRVVESAMSSGGSWSGPRVEYMVSGKGTLMVKEQSGNGKRLRRTWQSPNEDIRTVFEGCLHPFEGRIRFMQIDKLGNEQKELAHIILIREEVEKPKLPNNKNNKKEKRQRHRFRGQVYHGNNFVCEGQFKSDESYFLDADASSFWILHNSRRVWSFRNLVQASLPREQ